MDIIGKKWWYFLISAVVIVPGIFGLIFWGVRPAIDFTGGTLLEYSIVKIDRVVSNDEIKQLVQQEGIEVASIQQTEVNSFLMRLKPIEKQQKEKVDQALKEKFGNVAQVRYESVGPTVGKETTQNAVKAVIVASLAIIVYISLAFRKIPKPYSSWKFGIAAVVALIHDVIVVLGIFSLLGHFYKVEIDSLFITALLTVMGFSVHDTIVVFDRIRENLTKMSGLPFAQIVNESMAQTLARSLSTSLTVLFTLFALFLFGGESIRWFVAALLVGIISGTYSSIFNAAPILVVWDEISRRRRNKRP